MSLPRFSVKQVVFVNLLFVIVAVAGYQAATRIPVDLFPDISFNTAIVGTVWRGASADEVERLVTTKLEDEIQDVDGIKELRSFSQAGLSTIEIEWKETLEETEYESSLNELRAAVDRVPDLPEDAEETIITELSVSEVQNVCMIAVTDVGGVGEFTLREVARDIERRVERIPGVRKATLRGERERELRVYVDRERAMQSDLTLAEISAQIGRNNQNVPGGAMDTGEREITVRGLGNFATPEELAATVVKKDAAGNHVRLSDVARIEDGFERRVIYGRHNGNPTIIVGISKNPEDDITTLVDRVRAFMEEYESLLPPGIEAPVTWDSSRIVRDRMGTMIDNVMLGVVLVVFVLWLTVGFRNSLIVTIGIPFSFLSAFLLFPFFGITINLISLVGFVMVTGMLVDHAIIIVENIYRHIENGKPIDDAIIEGAEEVMWPVVATVVTTLAAFLPALMIQGTSGEFGSILPKTVILVLVGSLFEALIVLPAHYVDWGSRDPGTEKDRSGEGWGARIRRGSHALREAVEGWMDRLRDVYVRRQQSLLRHRYVFLATCCAAFYASCGLQARVPVDLFPSDFDQLFITVRTPTDYGVEQTNEVIREIEAEVSGLTREVDEFTSYVGFGMNADENIINGVNYGMLFVSLVDEPEIREDPKAALGRVRDHLDTYVAANPGRIDNLLVIEPRNGPPIGKPVAVRIQSDDYEVAKRISSEIQAELASIEGVFNIEDNVPEGPLELRVALDEHRASLQGLSFDTVATALRAANDGLVPSTFKDPKADEDIDIRVMLQGAQRSSMDDLLDVEMRAPGGQRVELGDVAQVEVARGYERLYHYDARRAVVVYADVDGENATSTAVNARLEARFADVPSRFPGVNLVFGGEFEATKQTVEDMQRAVGVAVLAIYAILATLFRSYLQPMVVMSVIGFAFIGVTIGLFVTGGALSIWVMYAGVGLAGIVVNDSLVLMDFVNRQREQGVDVDEAVRIASQRRFRPILLTTVTTIAGLLPMSLGLSGKSLVFGPFATAIVFGLSIASLLTLFVVPALYLTLEDVRSAFEGWRARRAPLAAPGAVAGGRGADTP
ncbi:MAG: efflux RND transporter permease subunit [Myxococcota bacterium]